MQNSTLYFIPHWDYLEFFQNNELTDCDIVLSPTETIKAHRAILANSSEFFLNTFTSGMEEDKTKRVNIEFNPCNLFSEVISWMYNGEITIHLDKCMSLLAIANYYFITQLQQTVQEYITNNCTPQNLALFIDQCYQNELQSELTKLVPEIAKNLDDLKKLSNFGDMLDVGTYAQVLVAKQLSPHDLIQDLKHFIGDYVLNDQDRKNLNMVFNADPYDLSKWDIFNAE